MGAGSSRGRGRSSDRPIIKGPIGEGMNGEGPRVLSCGCIYDPNPMPGGSSHAVFVHGEHRAIADAWCANKTPETEAAWLRQVDAHATEIKAWDR